MNTGEREKIVSQLSQSVTDLENIAGYSAQEDEEAYLNDLVSTAYYMADLGDEIVTFLNENRIKYERDDANTYFKIDSLDARLKAEFLASYFEEMTFSELTDVFEFFNSRNFF